MFEYRGLTEEILNEKEAGPFVTLPIEMALTPQ